MESELIRVETEARELGPLAPIAEAARDFIRYAKAENTLRAYRSDWEHFTAWCSTHRLASLLATPATVTLYLSNLAATCKASTLTRRVSAISQAHQVAGLESPTKSSPVCSCMAGIRRAKGTAPIGPVGNSDFPALAFLVGFGASKGYNQAFSRELDIFAVEADQFRSAESAREPHQEQGSIPDAAGPVRNCGHHRPDVLDHGRGLRVLQKPTRYGPFRRGSNCPISSRDRSFGP
jgi:hypothetical protein